MNIPYTFSSILVGTGDGSQEIHYRLETLENKLKDV